MLLARSLVNDTFAGATSTPGEGQILTDTAPFTIPMVNSAIRELYRELGNNGVATLIRDNFILSGITPINGPAGVGIPNPEVQVSITFAGYFDGTNTNTALKLAPDCLGVVRMWETPTNSGLPMIDMYQTEGGLPSRYQYSNLRDWEYRADGIYMVGSILTQDVRIRYVCQLPGNVTGAGTDFASLSVPILDSADALAWKIAKFYSFRLGADALAFADQQAQEAVRQLINRQVRAKQGTDYHRPAYGGGSWNNSDNTYGP